MAFVATSADRFGLAGEKARAFPDTEAAGYGGSKIPSYLILIYLGVRVKRGKFIRIINLISRMNCFNIFLLSCGTIPMLKYIETYLRKLYNRRLR